MTASRRIATRVAELVGERVPFVLATVVRAEMPTSARPGDAAIIVRSPSSIPWLFLAVLAAPEAAAALEGVGSEAVADCVGDGVEVCLRGIIVEQSLLRSARVFNSADSHTEKTDRLSGVAQTHGQQVSGGSPQNVG